MFRNDDPTAGSSLPAIGPAGTPGFFNSGNPAIGQPPTRLIRDWFNIVTEELIALTTMAGVTPNKVNLTQLTQSILAMSVIQDTGTVNSLVANTRVPITGLTAGTRILVVPAFTTTGPATANWSGNGAIPIVRPDASPLELGDIVQGQLIDLVYWGGSWLLLNPWRPPQVTQAISYWVDAATGNDNNSGTQAQPWLTLQHVDTALRRLNLGSNAVSVNCNGAFVGPGGTPTLSVEGPYLGGKGRGSVNFVFTTGSSITGNAATAIRATESAAFTLTGPVTLTATGGGDALAAIDGASIWFAGGPIFGAIPGGGSHVHADSGAAIYNSGGSYTIGGGAASHVLGTRGGNIKLAALGSALTVTLTGTPAFGIFANCGDAHMDILSNLITFSGAATGQRYLVSANGVIDTNNGVATYLPGSLAGAAVSGGQYI